MRASRAKLDRRRVYLIVVATLVLVGLLTAVGYWLVEKTGWPSAYGFYCSGRHCMLTYLYHSPQLLRGGSAYELGLFVFLWALPAFLFTLGILGVIKRWRSTNDQ